MVSALLLPLAALGAGNLGSCILFVALTLEKPFPLAVPGDLMPHHSAFHIMTIAKAVGQFSPFVLPGERGFFGFIYFKSFISFPFVALLSGIWKLKNRQYISGRFHGTLSLVFVCHSYEFLQIRSTLTEPSDST